MSVAFATASPGVVSTTAPRPAVAPVSRTAGVSAGASQHETNAHWLAVPAATTGAMIIANRRRSGRAARTARKAAAVNQPEKTTTVKVSMKGVSSTVELSPPDIDFDSDRVDGNVEEEPIPKEKGLPQFNWRKAWYPVHVTNMMDPVRPHKVQLLGEHIVMWNDGPTVDGVKQIGKWRVFEDRCPHRNAPLSEGRVEDDGSLLCSYHAWRFNGEGECTDLPYSPVELQKQHACNCRAKCRSYIVKEVDELLFVWPDNGPNALAESEAKPPQLIEELHDPELSKKWLKFPINLRDLELGWDVFFENAMDPSHFLVAHHNITGNRYTDPKWFDLKTVKKMSTEDGCAVKGLPGTFDFKPPCLVKNSQDGGVIFAIYNTPTSPGKCRHIGFLVLDLDSIAGDSGVVDKKSVELFTGPVPLWLQHLLTSFFLHQDAVILHHQEQNFADRGFEAKADSKKKFTEMTYTPNVVDMGSVMFRRWLRTRAGNGVPWAGSTQLAPRLRTNEKIFDVYNSHTKHCQHCKTAYNNFKSLQTGLWGGAAAAALGMEAGPERIAVGAACIACGLATQKVIDLFERYEFNHQDNK